MGVHSVFDDALFRLLRQGGGRLSNFQALVVLHVERLHDETAFRNVLAFCEHYRSATGQRALATVITPLAPILREELARAGFSEDDYAGRLAELAERADIGLHGHYLRTARMADGMIHAYWSERAVVSAQMAAEAAWLESHGLMRQRVYSAGWWYLDDSVREALRQHRFAFDFSPATGRFNQGALTWSRLRQGAHHVEGEGGATGPREVWAITGLCGHTGRTPMPRQLLQHYFAAWRQRRPTVVSLYNHDWDMRIEQALASIRDLQQTGVRFIGLETLIRQATA